ncbi:MAG: twin-arginine translocase subunit TatC [Verrucomicrobiota bacterium]
MIEFLLLLQVESAAGQQLPSWPLWLNLLLGVVIAVGVAAGFWRIWQVDEAAAAKKKDEPPESLDPAPDEDGLETKPFLDHLEDLRRMLLQCAGALVVTTVLCFLFTRQLIALLLQPLMSTGVNPHDFLWTKGVIDPFLIQMQTGLFGGFALALPAILYFVASFVLPALHAEEKRYLLPVFAAGAGLFLTGVIFCYFVLLPLALNFFLEYNAYLDLRPQWPFYDYIGFVLQMLIAFGLSFELPLVLLVLNVLGIISGDWLAHYRRHAVVVIMVFAACITPGGDLLSLFLLSAPMYVLYEATLLIIRVREKRIEAEDRRVDEIYRREVEEQQKP